MSKNVGIIFCALIFLAGCATPPEAPVPLVWSSTGTAPKPFTAPRLQPIVSRPKTNVPVAVRSSPPPATIARPAAAAAVTWTSLNRWAADRKIAAPRFISNSPVTTFALSSTNGVLVLAIGSRDATWNGMEIHLGFEPQFIDDQVFVHGLDLQKNFAPLLCEPPLTFGTNRVIVIDPGHGGVNVGTHSVLDGRFEKEFTLDWALRLAPLLAADGWKVLLTRTNDVDIALSNRVNFAEAQHADVFISLHFNSAAPDTKQAGLETYCLTPTGMASSLTRGYDDIWSQNFPNNAYDSQNLRLAVRLHSTLLHATGEEDRAVRRARFIGVLRGQKRPAILIEGGYLSNPHEAKRIEDPEFRQKLAEATAAALRQNALIETPKPEIKTNLPVQIPVIETPGTNEP